MAQSFEQRLDTLTKYPKAVKATVTAARDGDDLIDLAAVLAANRSAAWDIQRALQSELVDGEQSPNYVVSVGNTATRTYNTPRLLSKMMTALDMSLGDLLRYLMIEKVITISWSWTNLQRMVRAWNIDLTIVQREIQPDDPDADIGEHWRKSTPAYRSKEHDADSAR